MEVVARGFGAWQHAGQEELDVILAHGGDRPPLQLSKAVPLFHEVIASQASVGLCSSLLSHKSEVTKLILGDERDV